MKIKNEKSEIVNLNNQLVKSKISKLERKNNKKKIKNSFLSHSNVNLFSFYGFLIKSFLKGWYLSFFFLLVLVSFGLPFLYCEFISKINNYYIGLDFIFLVNAIIFSSFFSLNALIYFKSTDLHNRIRLLHLKNIGYAFLVVSAIFTYVMIGNTLTTLTFLLFKILKDIDAFYIYNSSILPFMIFSFLLTSTITIIFLIILSYSKSENKINYFSGFIMYFIIIVIYTAFLIVFFWTQKYTLISMFSSLVFLVYDLMITIGFFIFDLLLIILFNKKNY